MMSPRDTAGDPKTGGGAGPFADGAPAAQRAKRSWMQIHGQLLVDRGYPILPLWPGAKCPGQYNAAQGWSGYKKWSRHCSQPTQAFELAAWQTWPGCGVGIACGAVIGGLDIDVLDAEVNARIERLARAELGDTPTFRVGKAPKKLLPYRQATAIPKMARHPIEWLGQGSQWVAYNVHPDTAEPYRWPVEELSDIDVERLPMVGQDQVIRFLDKAVLLLPPELIVSRLGPDRSAEHYFHAGGSLAGTYAATAEALEHIANDDLPYDDWILIGLSIKGSLGEDGFELWRSWSARSAKDDPRVTEKTWAGLKPHSKGFGSLYYYASQRGWAPDPALLFNPDKEAAANHQAAAPLLAKLRSGAKPCNGTSAPVQAAEIKVPIGTEVEQKKSLDASVDIDEAAEASREAAAEQEQAEERAEVETKNAADAEIERLVAEAPGILGRLTRWMLASATSPQPLLSLGAAICGVGAVMGRRYRLTRPDTRSNIFALALADSGGGKDHPRRCTRRVMLEAGLGSHLGGENLASGAAVYSVVASHPCRLFQIDEFGHFVAAVLDPRSHAPHKREIMTMLTMFWSSASETVLGTEYANQRERPRQDIIQPCVSLYGSTVPAVFWAALQSGNVGDGSIARFLILPAIDDNPDTQLEPEPVEWRLEELAAELQAIAAGAAGHGTGNLAAVMSAVTVPEPYDVPLSEAARKLDAALAEEQLVLKRRHVHTAYSAIVARLREHTRKLALIAAVAERPTAPVVEAGHYQWAADFIRWSIQGFMALADRHIADSPVEASRKRLLEVIRKHSGGRNWLSLNEVTRKSQWLDAKNRDLLLGELLTMGYIEGKREASHGRPGTLYRYVPPRKRTTT